MSGSVLGKVHFLCQFLRSPIRVGSVCPSSRFLTRALAEAALGGGAAYGLIVDLGAGSGVVSRELLRRGVAPGLIVAVDISENFARVFHRNCPGVALRIGDARELAKILASHAPGVPVQAVISSLPLQNMSEKTVREIMEGVKTVLRRRQGALVQYTYALWAHSRLEAFGLFTQGRRHILRNLPPALVETYFSET